jgi:hypothetical protein
MPALCHFYGMQPSEFWRLNLRELDALAAFMARSQE